MVVPRYERYERVHETDYGEPSFGGAFVGIVQIVVGLVSFVLGLLPQKGRHRA